MIKKATIIEQIKQAEKRAEEDLETAIILDLNRIKRRSINNKHLEEMVSLYISNVSKAYHSLQNYYKASWEGFDDLKGVTTTKDLNEEDRLDFIGTMLTGFLEKVNAIGEDNLNSQDLQIGIEFLDQMKNLSTIVYDTYTLKFKEMRLIETLRKLPKKNQEQKPANENFGFKGDRRELEQLYQQMKSVFFDFEDVTFEIFKDVMVKDWDSHNSTLKFKCANRYVVEFIERCKLFENLSFKSVGDSKKWKSKGGKIITKSNLSSSKSQNYTPENIGEIREIVSIS